MPMGNRSIFGVIEEWHNRASDTNFVWFPFVVVFINFVYRFLADCDTRVANIGANKSCGSYRVSFHFRVLFCTCKRQKGK